MNKALKIGVDVSKGRNKSVVVVIIINAKGKQIATGYDNHAKIKELFKILKKQWKKKEYEHEHK